MTGDFSIDVSWLPGGYGPEEIRETAALLRVMIRGKDATRVDDGWSKSVQQGSRVSVYPLALWIAASWWRLRWEPLPFRTVPEVSWRMAHEMPAAGHGYLWPLLTFDSDGETVDAMCRPSNPLSAEPIRYLADFRESLEASCFEKTIDCFMSLVLARLDAVGVAGTGLHGLWNEVLEERLDPESTRGRKLEARLGFDPDEAPEEVLSQLINLSDQAGAAAVEELAPVCAGPQPDQTLRQIEDFSKLRGASGQISIPASLRENTAPDQSLAAAPGQKGWILAKAARRSYGFNSAPLLDGEIAALLGVPAATLESAGAANPRPPLGLAIRSPGTNQLKFLFRKRNRPALRFEAARFLADEILVPAKERWLPATDTGTARQKAQRAFAAEFLCPIDALVAYLNGDFSSEAVEDAGEHFGVSELAVKSHLANHALIPFEAVTV